MRQRVSQQRTSVRPRRDHAEGATAATPRHKAAQAPAAPAVPAAQAPEPTFIRMVSFERRYGTWHLGSFEAPAAEILVRARMQSLSDMSEMLIAFVSFIVSLSCLLLSAACRAAWAVACVRVAVSAQLCACGRERRGAIALASLRPQLATGPLRAGEVDDEEHPRLGPALGQRVGRAIVSRQHQAHSLIFGADFGTERKHTRLQL